MYIEQNEENLGGTEQSLDLLMTSGHQDMYSASLPRNTERVDIQGSDRDNATTWSEYYFPSPGSHLPTYEEHIES